MIFISKPLYGIVKYLIPCLPFIGNNPYVIYLLVIFPIFLLRFRIRASKLVLLFLSPIAIATIIHLVIYLIDDNKYNFPVHYYLKMILLAFSGYLVGRVIRVNYSNLFLYSYAIIIILLELVPDRPFSILRGFADFKLGSNIYASMISLFFLYYLSWRSSFINTLAIGQSTQFLALVVSFFARFSLLFNLLLYASIIYLAVSALSAYGLIDLPNQLSIFLAAITSNRWQISQAFFLSIIDMPFYGYGMLEWNFISERYLSSIDTINNFTGSHRYLHNSFLEIIASYGYFGLISVMMLILYLYNMHVRHSKYNYKILPVAYFVILFGTNAFFASSFLWLSFFIFANLRSTNVK